MNNKGFAVSAFMYMLLILGIILILATLSILSSRKMILDKQKSVAMDNSLQSRKKICKAINGVKLLIPGTEYECQVNDTNKFNFYVLSVEGSKVNLIMDRNICENGQAATEENKCLIAWYASSTDNSNGPVTTIEGLYNATKDWDNIPNMNLDYSDEGHIANASYGYGKIKTTSAGIKITMKDETEVTGSENQTPVIRYEANKPLKARLPKYSEVTEAGCTGNNGSCPVWLTNGLAQFSTYYPDNDHILEINGYWTLSSTPNNAGLARIVHSNGIMFSDSTSYASYYGLRTVITVLKSNLYN